MNTLTSAWQAWSELEAGKEPVLVPSPALSEVLVTEGVDVQDVLATLRGSSVLRIGDFDERAAVELAMRLRNAIKSGGPREGMRITKSAMKFDRQIVAISLVNGARLLYSDDDGVEKFASSCGLATKRVADLPVPASQGKLFEEQHKSGDAEGPDAASAGENEM
ncbi:MAG: hypothetical protein ACKV22_29760 [Bryobacteraceae bacterium]